MNNCNLIFYSILTFIIMSCINLDCFWYVSCSFLLLLWYRLLAASVKTLDRSLGHSLQVSEHCQMRAYKKERANERVRQNMDSYHIKSNHIKFTFSSSFLLIVVAPHQSTNFQLKEKVLLIK